MFAKLYTTNATLKYGYEHIPFHSYTPPAITVKTDFPEKKIHGSWGQIFQGVGYADIGNERFYCGKI